MSKRRHGKRHGGCFLRGKTDPQSTLFVAAIDLEERIRPDHPLGAIKQMADENLRALD